MLRPKVALVHIEGDWFAQLEVQLEVPADHCPDALFT